MSKFVFAQSRASARTLHVFLTKGSDATLTAVPGLGPKTLSQLSGVGVTTTLQLFGVFLSGYSADATVQEVCDSFWDFLERAGTPAPHRSTCIHAMLEKVAVFFPECFPLESLAAIRES
jgi:hypothetical protein